MIDLHKRDGSTAISTPTAFSRSVPLELGKRANGERMWFQNIASYENLEKSVDG